MRVFKKISNLLFLLSSAIASSQTNLVPNPSFESYTVCPSIYAELANTGNWYSATDGSSDYFDTCSVGGWDAPVNWIGNQIPYNNGGGYAGIITQELVVGNPTRLYREYIQTQLTSSLVTNQIYFLSFYVSVADSLARATDGLGAYVSSNPITLIGTAPATEHNLPVTPQVCSPLGQVINDGINWVKISGAFRANGGEKYITIGNFQDDHATTSIRRFPNRSIGMIEAAYYYVDNVCLSTSATLAGVDSTIIGLLEVAPREMISYSQSEKHLTLKNYTGKSELKIIDLYGNLIKSLVSFNEERISLSNMCSGMYTIVVNNSNRTICRKIIIE